MLRTTFIKAPQFELGAKVTYNDFVFGGLSYRNRESVIGLIGLNYKNFVLAYSYDLTLTSIRNYSSGSHEVLFAYQFNNKSKTPQLKIEEPTEPKDSDGDGVFDDLDECPNVVGPKDNKGCPWPDSDKDGLSDNKDECPKIAGPIENRGCPYGDTDGDGLNDNEDECPKTSGPVTNKGCPIIEKKDQEVIDVAVKNLEFKINQAVIQQISFPSLNTLAEKLKEKENWILNLSGHTDNLGDDDANMILSKNRSEAVKQYLISQGISESRIKVNYFGETKPIADNNTSEGRQKNRRVEFVIGFE
jgi:outer membrane protein OmpA-like peptidoglycan-associated protein